MALQQNSEIILIENADGMAQRMLHCLNLVAFACSFIGGWIILVAGYILNKVYRDNIQELKCMSKLLMRANREYSK